MKLQIKYAKYPEVSGTILAATSTGDHASNVRTAIELVLPVPAEKDKLVAALVYRRKADQDLIPTLRWAVIKSL
jgi:hypothetical protein